MLGALFSCHPFSFRRLLLLAEEALCARLDSAREVVPLHFVVSRYAFLGFELFIPSPILPEGDMEHASERRLREEFFFLLFPVAALLPVFFFCTRVVKTEKESQPQPTFQSLCPASLNPIFPVRLRNFRKGSFPFPFPPVGNFRWKP